MIEKFKTKPVKEEVFEAIKFTGDNVDEIIEFIKDAPNFKVLEGNIVCMVNDHIGWFLRNLDYVARLSNGEFTVKVWEEVNYKSIPIKDEIISPINNGNKD